MKDMIKELEAFSEVMQEFDTNLRALVFEASVAMVECSGLPTEIACRLSVCYAAKKCEKVFESMKADCTGEQAGDIEKMAEVLSQPPPPDLSDINVN